jgi:hypothetical protein
VGEIKHSQDNKQQLFISTLKQKIKVTSCAYASHHESIQSVEKA